VLNMQTYEPEFGPSKVHTLLLIFIIYSNYASSAISF